ncbi:MAG: HEAT repeat domain-containing protein, partial [Planctomycetota bacterium]
MLRWSPSLLLLLAVFAGLPAAGADTVVLKRGRKLEHVVVSRQDDEVVVVNPWNSRYPEMTWEIPEKNRIPRAKVREVVIADPPLVEIRRRAVLPTVTADEHVALAEFARQHKLKGFDRYHLAEALALEPTHVRALELFGGPARWERAAKGDPHLDPQLRALEREYVTLKDPAALKAKLAAMREAGSKRRIEVLERVRQSAALPRGLRTKVPLTLRSEEAPGATYCIYVPRSYDPLRPTPLVVGLHGGGRGGRDDTIVTGSGEQAMPFYRDQAERWGWIVVCPTAVAAPWAHPKNDPWIRALLDEMRALYNVDENRAYLTGHSMGGYGTWYWGPKLADVWAAISPCAGGGGPNGVAGRGLPVYIYHGTDDKVVPPGSDRSAARSLAGGKKKIDFVYTEIDQVGHGFPAWVRKDIFRFFAGRAKDRSRRPSPEPRSSFERKVTKDEIVAFSNPKRLPDAEEEDAGTRALIDALERGGGAAAEAAIELGKRHDARTAKAVARVLRSKKSKEDVRVAACRALGAIGLAVCIRPLARALGDEDYRVVEAAVQALGETGLAAAAKDLAKGVAVLGERFEESIQGNRIPFRAYEVRLGSMALALDACAKLSDVDRLLPAVEKEIVVRVFERTEPLVVLGEKDPRFKRNPSRARLALGEALARCLLAWKDPRGAALLERVADAWKTRQPALAVHREVAADGELDVVGDAGGACARTAGRGRIGARHELFEVAKGAGRAVRHEHLPRRPGVIVDNRSPRIG